MQSAIGLIQLKRLNKWTKLRERNALIIADGIKKIDSVRVPLPEKNLTHAWYKFYAYIKKDKLKKDWNRDKIISEISKIGMPAFSGSCSEIYKERCFKDLGLSPKSSLTNAKILGESSLMFLVHPTIEIDQINRYKDAIKEVLEKASK